MVYASLSYCADTHEGDREGDEAGGQGGEAPLQAASPLPLLAAPQQALQRNHHPCPPQVPSCALLPSTAASHYSTPHSHVREDLRNPSFT